MAVRRQALTDGLPGEELWTLKRVLAWLILWAFRTRKTGFGTPKTPLGTPKKDHRGCGVHQGPPKPPARKSAKTVTILADLRGAVFGFRFPVGGEHRTLRGQVFANPKATKEKTPSRHRGARSTQLDEPCTIMESKARLSRGTDKERMSRKTLVYRV